LRKMLAKPIERRIGSWEEVQRRLRELPAVRHAGTKKHVDEAVTATSTDLLVPARLPRRWRFRWIAGATAVVGLALAAGVVLGSWPKRYQLQPDLAFASGDAGEPIFLAAPDPISGFVEPFMLPATDVELSGAK
jgi:hypothetical protein